jgi:hypothetical protein
MLKNSFNRRTNTMKSLTSILRHTVTAALVAVCLLLALPTPVSAQVQSYGNNGQYGVSQFKVNGELVASRFNYQVFSQPNTGGGFANFQNFNDGCYYNLGSNIRIVPFNTNATVTVNDTSTSANTETVALSAVTTNSAPSCVLSLATSNAHTGSYFLSSGTCGIAEALNFLGQGNKGTIAVTQEFYDQGCTVATITGTVVGLIVTANQQVHDWTTGLWYSLQPTTLSALAVPTTSATLVCAATAGLVCQSATTGGTWPNSAEFVGDIYVDALGGWSVASTTATLTPSASGTNVLQFNSPAASTGAVGWLPFGGLTYNTVTYVLPVTATNCTLSTKFTGYPVCAIGSNATMLGPVVTTSLIPQLGGLAAAYNPNIQSHTTFGLRPNQKPGLGFQQNYGPFTACPVLTAGQLCVVGTVQLPTGFIQNLGIGGTVRFTFDVSSTFSTQATVSGIDVEIGDITDFSTGTPKIVCTLFAPVATTTANVKYHEQCDWTVNALGATGSMMPGGFSDLSIAASGSAVLATIAEQGTAAITTDILDQDAVYFVWLQTGGAESTTPPKMLNLKIEVL